MDYTNCVNLIRFIYLLEHKMTTLTKVTVDNLYETINSYADTNKITVKDYDGMVTMVLGMVKDGYCFTMDRDILRDAMESLTYMYCPNDDMNKDRLRQQLLDEDSDEEEEGCSSGDEGEEFGNMDMLKMMQMMSGMPPPSNEEEVVVKKEGSDSKEGGECCGPKKEKEEEELIPSENEKETESEKVD